MIPLEYEPQEQGVFDPAERCCFCRAFTRYWTALPHRKPGEQVACCQPCAKTRTRVPSKQAWCEKERRLYGGNT